MKKYLLPVIALILDISLCSFRPELIIYRRVFQLILYLSLVRILVFKTTQNNTLELKFIKWVLSIGLILPVFLIQDGSLTMNLFYIADVVLLVPIFFHEIIGKSSDVNEKEHSNLQLFKFKNYKSWEIIKIFILTGLLFTTIAFGVFSAKENYGFIAMFCGIFGAHAANSLIKLFKDKKVKVL